MECLFCGKEFDESLGCCPCCGQKVDAKNAALADFKKTPLKEDFENAKKKWEVYHNCNNFEMKYFYLKRGAVLGKVSSIVQLTIMDYDCLIVLLSFKLSQFGHVDQKYDIVGFYDKEYDKVKRARLTDKLYLDSSRVCIGSGSSGFNDGSFRPFSVDTFAPIGKSKRIPDDGETWDLSTLDEEMDV